MQDPEHYPISIAEILRAREVLRTYLRPTALIRYEGLSRAIDAYVYVKHENHNPTGTFKIRGGINLMHHLKKAGVPGVITYSTGNHGLSVATAARWMGIPATIVVPCGSNPVKVAAIRETGAELIESGANFDEAGQTVQRLVQERGLHFAHPANVPHLINGVGTGFLEVLEALPDLDVMIVPLGAGSEVAGAITALRALKPNVEIIAVQGQKSPAAYESWKAKKMVQAPNTTFAGGFATGQAYELPFSIYKDGLDDFVLLTEDEIYDGIAAALHYTHNLAEGAGGASIMAAWKLRDRLKGRRVALQMSGCNASATEITAATQRAVFVTGLVA
jgi:threonine dehydratase